MAAAESSGESILILGSGALGTPVLSRLAFSPHRSSATKITLASRNPGSSLAKLSANHGINQVALDIPSLSLPDLTRELAGFTTVIGCTGMTFPAGTQLKIARAVLGAGVARYFPWQFGVDYDQLREGGSWQDLFMEQIQVRDLLRSQQHTKWVIVSNGVFADFLMDENSGFGIIEGSGKGKCTVRALGGWDNRVTATKVEDIARTVEALALEERDVEGVVFIAGQTVSYREIASAVEKALGAGNVHTENWDMDFLVQELKSDPTNGIKKYRAAFGAGTGMSWDVEETWNRKRGLEFAGLDEWIQAYTVK